MLKKKNKGFTLAELLIVVAIIAILVAISLPLFSSQIAKANLQADQTHVSAAKASAVAEYLDTNSHDTITYYFDAGIAMANKDNSEGIAGYGKSTKKPYKNQTGADVGVPVSEDGSKADGYINSEKSVETAAKLQKFFDEKLANIDPTPTEFQDQKAAMWIAGNTNQMVQFEQFPDLHWGATYLPKTGDHVVSNCGSWTLGISKDCKDPDAAYVALEFMTNSESTRLYGEVGGYPPARKSAYENNTQWDEYPYSLAKEQLFEAAVPRPKTPVYTVLTSKFAEAMLDIFTGSDAKESLDAVASYVDDEYARVQDSMK